MRHSTTDADASVLRTLCLSARTAGFGVTHAFYRAAFPLLRFVTKVATKCRLHLNISRVYHYRLGIASNKAEARCAQGLIFVFPFGLFASGPQAHVVANVFSRETAADLFWIDVHRLHVLLLRDLFEDLIGPNTGARLYSWNLSSRFPDRHHNIKYPPGTTQ